MKKVIIALMVLGICGTSVFAGEWKKEGSVLLGMGIPSGDAGDVVDSGMAFGLDYDGYKINDNWSIAGAFNYISSPDKTTAGVDYELSTWGLSPYAKYSKEVDMGGKKTNVYGAVGVGYYSVTAKASIGAISAEATDTKFGLNFGGGIAYPIADKMSLGLDLRYHMVYSDLSYFIPAVKFTYSF